MNAREFFTRQHKAAGGRAARQTVADAEQERKAALRVFAEFCEGEIDLSSALIEDGVVTFPDGLCLSFYFDDYGANGFRVQGQCPLCGEMCWSEPCFTASKVGEMLIAFKPRDHRCPVPDEERSIAVGDIVDVEGEGESVILGSVKVLATPASGGYWQFAGAGNVYAVGAGAPFLIIREGRKVGILVS